MGISKNKLKLIKQLNTKKYRNQYGLFIVEGVKGVNEFLASNFILNELFYTEENAYAEVENKTLLTEAELKKISNLKTPNKVLALFEIPLPEKVKDSGLIVVLDTINDPGNLGTIIRLCDWYGVTQLVCSPTTVDCFNTKVIQSSMGSLTRISIVYTEIENYLKSTKLPIFGADMNGESAYKVKLPHEAILVMGNEANGISSNLKKCITKTITIPQFGEIKATESLNVATATAILLSEFKRS